MDFREAFENLTALQRLALFIHPASKVFWNFSKQCLTSYLVTNLCFPCSHMLFSLLWNERENLGSCVPYIATEVFWLFRQTVWCVMCSFRQASLAIWEYWRKNPSYLKIKHCTAKQTKSSHNVKTDSKFIDKKLSLVFLKPHERRLYEIHWGSKLKTKWWNRCPSPITHTEVQNMPIWNFVFKLIPPHKYIYATSL